MASAEPLVYRLAVSIRVPPSSANSSNCLALSLSYAPQPQSVPKVMVPRASSLTRRPDWPSNV